MELGLSLGDAPKPFGFLQKSRGAATTSANKSLSFCMAMGINDSNEEGEGPPAQGDEEEDKDEDANHHISEESTIKEYTRDADNQRVSVGDPPLQLDLLPLAPVPRQTPSHQHLFPWSSDNGGGSSAARGFDVNRPPPAAEEVSSPNSAASSFQMDFSIFGTGRYIGGGRKRDSEDLVGGGDDEGVEAGERASSRASDEDDNCLSRKKLRLSKEQSAYLEESFKEHNTLNPKQKLALAKQLNLRPRQVEVWFQNRRARTKLKQTEVDCEYLKRCCETLTEENRRLHKELQELRALKSTSNPFYMQPPATTLTMCPSCERVATTSTASPTRTSTTANNIKASTDSHSKAAPTLFPVSRPSFYPFSHHPSAAS